MGYLIGPLLLLIFSSNICAQDPAYSRYNVSTRPILLLRYENKISIKQLNGGFVYPVLWK